MELKPNEIEAVEQIGQLNGSPVRMVKTIGGFWIVVGKPKGKGQEEALAAGSHPAIVKYNVEKQFSEFQPTLAKSELTGSSENVRGYTELLPQEMRKGGYEMYSLSKGSTIDYILTKHGAQVHSFHAEVSSESLKFKKSDKPLNENIKGFSRAVSVVATQQAKESGKKYVEHEEKKFCVNRLSRK
jgi:hypothetical protein